MPECHNCSLNPQCVMNARSHHHPHHGPHTDDIAFVSCVSHRYADGTAVEFCGLDFCAHRGERTVLLGPNGAGKTTLLYHLLGLLKSAEGTVRVLGADPATEWDVIRQRIGVVLQNVDQQLIMPTVYDDIAFSPRQYGWEDARVDREVRAVADTLDISHLLNRSPQGLSGGEKRKVALAGALIIDPELLILDEPFEGLDPTSRVRVTELLNSLSRDRKMSLVMSTHDIDSVGEFADYCYVLSHGGAIVLAGTPLEVFSHADTLAASNIRPPLIGQVFAGLASKTGVCPTDALTAGEAVESLVEWAKRLDGTQR